MRKSEPMSEMYEDADWEHACDPRFLSISLDALSRVMNDDLEAAVEAINTIQETYDSNGVFAACLLWIDVTIRALHIPWPTKTKLSFVDYDTNTTLTEVPPHVRWAGEMFNGRLGDNAHACTTLFTSFDNNEDYRQALWQLLNSCAQMIQIGRSTHHERQREGNGTKDA